MVFMAGRTWICWAVFRGRCISCAQMTFGSEFGHWVLLYDPLVLVSFVTYLMHIRRYLSRSDHAAHVSCHVNGAK